MLSVSGAIGTTVPHDLHRSRRAPLNPYFSKTSIRRIEPVIQQTLENLLKRFSACAKTEDIMRMNMVYQAATSDIITGYCFGVSNDYLKMDDYNAPFFEAVATSFEMVWWLTHIPWLGLLMVSVPASVMSFIMPGMESLWQMQRVSSADPGGYDVLTDGNSNGPVRSRKSPSPRT